MRRAETDTPVEVETFLRRRLMQKSGVERLRMAGEMFDAATALIVASLPEAIAENPVERRIAVFERRYWPERKERLIASVIEALRRP